MGNRHPAAVMAATVLAAGLLCGCGHSTRATVSEQSQALADASTFLARYVNPDGRVVRRDQGGDTVSEGQGYALLLAYADGRRSRFSTIWSWTAHHLQRSDGLFGYDWSAGRLSSSTPAADADTQIAWALDLAGAHWHVSAYSSAARRIATAIATAEIGYDGQGHPTLAAGPWAIQSGRPVTVEPGYWTYPADDALASLTGDNRWKALADADLAHLITVTGDGASLPPDWAAVGSGVTAISPPSNPGSTPVSGQDGLRAMVWAACTGSSRALGGKWWPLVASTAMTAPLSRDLNGTPTDTSRSPLAAVAVAAAAAEAGQPARRDALLGLADRIAQQYPTYYGTAWAALGRIILTTRLFPGCP